MTIRKQHLTDEHLSWLHYNEKLNVVFFQKKVSPGVAVEQFISELDIVLRNLQDSSVNNHCVRQRQPHERRATTIPYDVLLATIQSRPTSTNDISIALTTTKTRKKKKVMNYGRIVKRLKYKLRSSNILN